MSLIWIEPLLPSDIDEKKTKIVISKKKKRKYEEMENDRTDAWIKKVDKVIWTTNMKLDYSKPKFRI